VDLYFGEYLFWCNKGAEVEVEVNHLFSNKDIVHIEFKESQMFSIYSVKQNSNQIFKFDFEVCSKESFENCKLAFKNLNNMKSNEG